MSREKLVKTLEGFYEYETGTTPRITFVPTAVSAPPALTSLSVAPSRQGLCRRERLGQGLLESITYNPTWRLLTLIFIRHKSSTFRALKHFELFVRLLHPDE